MNQEEVDEESMAACAEGIMATLDVDGDGSITRVRCRLVLL